MRRRRLIIGVLALPLAVALVLVLAVFAFAIGSTVGLTKLYRISTSSMEPTIRCAKPAEGCSADSPDRILVCAFCGDVHRGDIVAYHPPRAAADVCGSGGTFVGRVIALPGELFEEQNGFVYIDGRRLEEPYIRPERRDSRSLPSRRIPAGQYFVLGDNRARACDSRVFGAVAEDDVVGKAVATYWPPSRLDVGRP